MTHISYFIESRETIDQLQQRIRAQYEDLTDIAYRLHAVFIHQGMYDGYCSGG